MKTIWKFKLDITDEQTISVPKKSLLLQTVLIQDGTPVVWVMCDSSIKENEDIVIVTLGTGNPIPENIEKLLYVGTYQLLTFVGHVFVKIQK